MYKMPYFTEDNADEVLSFMKTHPFVTLIANDGKRSVATQVPALIEERDGNIVLRVHIMRKTDHHLAIEQNPDVLILFQGPHCYVSSSWYTEKMGATWNYQTVHARGTAKLVEEAALAQMLKDLMEKYERPQEKPLYLEALPEGYVSGMIKGISGYEIELTDIYPIFKLSQNRDDESYKNIVRHLLATDDTEAHKVAEEMKKLRSELFTPSAP